jgi:NTE family protein
MLKLSSLVCVILFSSSLFAQGNSSTTNKNRPKIGLVLSGGGAKGFAHIGAIKLLEEVGIKPDYVTGTSMGSIVGALYAMGYTTQEMQNISDTTDWSVVLSNTVSLRDVVMSEKPYYGTFLTELDIKKSGVSLPGGLIEGQNLLEYLSFLSTPVHGIDNFLDFPIPYTCVATDIVTGKPVALNQGNITDAIRASMAIPTAFTPVEYDTLLLVDGGWTRNLPVQEAKDMGADIIISIDVGAPLKTKEELESLVSIIDQTMWILSVQDTEKQLEMSDYVVSPSVQTFSTFDFDKADEIIELGYQEAAKQRDAFEALAKKIYPSGRNEKVIKKPFSDSLYTISNIVVTGTKLTSPSFVSGRLDIKPNVPIPAKEVSRRIGLLYGSMYYKKIGFQLVPLADGTQELRVQLVEDNPSKLKLSFYYDDENSIGINVNMTLRNLVLKNSRLIFDGFISENPILGLKYLKYFGPDQQAFVFGEFRFTNDSRFQWENFYGQEAEYNYREFKSNIGLAYTFDNRLLLALGVGLTSAKMKPTLNPDTIIESYSQTQIPIRLVLSYNTFDRAVFPTQGLKIHASASYMVNTNQSAIVKNDVFGIPKDELQEVVDEELKISPFVMFRFTAQEFFPIAKKLSLYADARLEVGSSDKIGFNEYSKVGGIAPILDFGVPFWGLRRNELKISQLGIASLGFQWNLWGNVFLKGKVNYLNAKYPMNWFFSGDREESFELYGKTHDDIFGFGGELAYNSPIGPLRITLHQNQYSNNLNVFVGIGYNIYKSHNDF